MPDISIIMPLYNANRYLREALDSMVNQTFRNWELLAINEPDSNDGTSETVREYAAKDQRIKLIQNETRLGIAASLNVGLKLAKGEFVARMDADDISMPQRLERQFAFMLEHPDVDICGIKPQMIGNIWEWPIETNPDYLRSDCLFYLPVVHPTVMMRISRLAEFGLEYNPDYRYSEDYEFFARASKYLCFGNINEPLFKYRWHDESATNAGGSLQKELYRDVCRNMILQAGIQLSDSDADLLCVHTTPTPETGHEALDYFRRIDLLLKKIYFCDTARNLYGADALYNTMWRRWKDAFDRISGKDSVMSDARVADMHKRGFFYNQTPYKAKTVSKKTPKVTILLPVLNGEAYIADTLRSLFEQTFTDFEVLLVNEMTTKDDTLKIALSFGDSRLRIFQKESDPGLSESLNIGIREARGTYIARADADDLYPPERLKKQVDFMDAHPEIGLCGSWQQHFGRYTAIHKPLETHEELKAKMIFICDVCHSTIMLRKSAFIENDLRYDGNYLSEDFELWTRAVHKIKFHTIQEVLGEYRVWDGNLTTAKMNSFEAEAQKIIARTLRENLKIKLPEKDLILLSGWTNPFTDSTRSDRKELIGREKALFNKIRKQNAVLKVYDPAALEKALTQREKWMYGNYSHVEIVDNKGRPIRNLVKKVLRPIYRPFYNRCMVPIINLITELTWKMDTRIWKSEELIIQKVNDRILESEQSIIHKADEHILELEDRASHILETMNRQSEMFDERIRRMEQKFEQRPCVRCKYLLVNDTFDTFHHGSTATSISIRNHLGNSVSFIPYSLIFSPPISPRNLREFISQEFEIKWATANNWLINKVELCDDVVINGEGSMARYGAWTLNYLYFAYYCAAKLNKRVHLINHSIYVSNYAEELPQSQTEDFAEIIRLTYLTLSSCYVREPESLAQLETIVPGKGKLSFDCVCLYINETYVSRPAECRNRIVISGGNFLGNWYVPFLNELLKILPGPLSEMPIAFLYSDVTYSDMSGDDKLREEIASSFEIEKIIVKTTDEWLDVIGSAALFVSGRFHHSIACFMLDTPFLSFKTDTGKMEGMLQIIEKTENLLPGDINGAISKAKNLLNSQDFFSENDKQIKEKIVDLALRNFEFKYEADDNG